MSLPVLAAPGAGIPWWERHGLGLLLRLLSWQTSQAKATQTLADACTATMSLVAQCPPAQRTTRVLIPRLAGLEDSSRYYSVYMTLEHLRMVNGSIAQILPLLAQGHVPPGTASTAAMKPGVEVSPEIEHTFPSSCHAVIAAAHSVGELRTASTYRHPWFGPFNAAAWYLLAGVHTRLHQRQIALILQRLTKALP